MNAEYVIKCWRTDFDILEWMFKLGTEITYIWVVSASAEYNCPVQLGNYVSNDSEKGESTELLMDPQRRFDFVSHNNKIFSIYYQFKLKGLSSGMRKREG